MKHEGVTLFGKAFGRRALLAGGAAVLATPFIARSGLAAAKQFRISTPGTAEEWQSKALEAFKESLNKNAAGQFDVQIHYNGTLFAQGTEIEAMQRGNLEVGMISPQDIAAIIPEYSVFTTGYLMRDPAHLDAVYDGEIGTEYAARVEKDVQVHIVRSQYLGTRHVILRAPKDIKTPADMAGQSCACPAPMPGSSSAMRSAPTPRRSPSRKSTSPCRRARSTGSKTLCPMPWPRNSMKSPSRLCRPRIWSPTPSSPWPAVSGAASPMTRRRRSRPPRRTPRSSTMTMSLRPRRMPPPSSKARASLSRRRMSPPSANRS
ncbi:MAG: TRAP transporter substrate-binding protein DctP [Rhodospirillaceae bacterium]|nr:TRAP transporter substrate-binding protein DctP [Rhodospirillaceae bacterium]